MNTIPIQNPKENGKLDFFVNDNGTQKTIMSIDANGVHGAPASFRNKIINGNFDIWQRGITQTGSGYGSADRWRNENNISTQLVDRVAFTAGQTDVPNEPSYYIQYNVATGGTSASFVSPRQHIEDVRTFAGKTVTLSFYGKVNSNKNIAVEFVQVFGTGGSSPVNEIGVTTIPLTTSWQKKTVTITLPSIAGKTIGTDSYLRVAFWFDAGSDFDLKTNSLGYQSGLFSIAQVQLEEGSIATQFEQRPYGLELSLCQRYYERNDSFDGNSGWWSGDVTNATTYYSIVPFKVTKKRVADIVILDSNLNFFNAPTSTINTLDTFRLSASAASTNAGGYYRTKWTADAEI
jgi:hypothetical protein